jgi:hypothetical protein
VRQRELGDPSLLGVVSSQREAAVSTGRGFKGGGGGVNFAAGVTLGTSSFLRWSATKYLAAYDSGNDFMFIGSSASTPTNSPLYTYIEATERVLVRFTTAGGVFQVIPAALAQSILSLGDAEARLGADNGPNAEIRTKADRDIKCQLGTVTVFTVAGSTTTDQVQTMIPVNGSAAGTSLQACYGKDGFGAVPIPSDANYTVGTTAVAELVPEHLNFTGTLTAGRTMTMPAPAANDASYEKTVTNSTTQTLTFSVGGGATIAVATLKTAILKFCPVATGVLRKTADA